MIQVIKKFAAPCQPERSAKDRICLHFTAGTTVAGAVSHWQQTYQKNVANGNPWTLGTAYIVDRNGDIYEVFDPEKWAYQLGIGNAAVEARTIGIEVVNLGPLVASKGVWVPPGAPSIAVPDIVKVPLYRQFDTFQAVPEVQAAATNQLIKQLCTRFRIPALVPPAAKRGICDPRWVYQWRGICAHTNFVEKDRWDWGPDHWDWSRTAREIA